MSEFTENQIVQQFLDEHWQEILDIMGARLQDASSIERVRYDSVRHVGILCSYVYEGVHKVVNVTPDTLIEGLASLNEDLRNRCIEAAATAERQAGYAGAQGDYAKSQGDRVASLISEISELKARVKSQGDLAEQQGAAALQAKTDVETWFQLFKENAETWYDGITDAVADWYSGVRQNWTEWFNARKTEWREWFDGIKADWTAWFNARKDEWTEWFNASKQSFDAWFENAKESFASWFASVEEQYDAKYAEIIGWFGTAEEKVDSWEQDELARKSAEEIRQELQSHPPVPSTRGYWMFWDVETGEYVESGYSSRGTMDWPEFFWDYETMGIGVITSRDYSRFFVDDQGRFGMNM